MAAEKLALQCMVMLSAFRSFYVCPCIADGTEGREKDARGHGQGWRKEGEERERKWDGASKKDAVSPDSSLNDRDGRAESLGGVHIRVEMLGCLHISMQRCARLRKGGAHRAWRHVRVHSHLRAWLPTRPPARLARWLAGSFNLWT